MKKHLLLLINVAFFSLFATSCSNDEPVVDNPKTASKDVLYLKRSKDDVMKIATNYVNSVNGDKSRSAALQIDESSLTPVLNSYSRQTADTLIYAVDFKNNNGYMLISANQLTEPILAIIDSGSYSDDEGANDTGYEDFMDAAQNYVTNSIIPSGGFEPNPGVEPIRKLYHNDTITLYQFPIERLEVKWGQGWPENQYCPNKVAGCVPVAAAQVLSYLKPSLNMKLTFDGRPKDYVNLDWTSLCEHKTSLSSYYPSQTTIDVHYSGCNADEEAHDMLALLARQLGVESHADYSKPDRTGAHTLCAAGYIKSVAPNNEYTNVSGSYFYDYIKNGGVALVEGWTANGVGHAWVIDGVYGIEYNITTYYNYCPSTGEYDSKTTKTEKTKYVHCNWGWSGSKNGYFLDGIYDTDKGINPPSGYVPGSGRSRYYFDRDIFGIVFK